MGSFNYVASLLQGASHDDITPFTSSRPELKCIFRDVVFKEILDSFEGKPIEVFQVGAIESMEDQFRLGSGWSDIFWGNYIKRNGGKLVIVDIDINHIANSNFLAQNLQYEVHLHIADAARVIKEGFDVYYLDGADISYAEDAHDQTMNQFKIIENTKSIVLVDDVPTKARKLKDYVIAYGLASNWIVKEYSCGNGMMTIDMRNQNV